MFYHYVRSHDRLNHSNKKHQLRQAQSVQPIVPSTLALLVIFGPFFFCGYAIAIPLSNDNSIYRRQDSSPRRDNGQNHEVSPSIWIPILILGLMILAGALGVRFRRSISVWIAQRRRSAPETGRDGTRELTAEQLAGTINENATSGNTSNTNRTRRNRRPRRTPSQISTTSLPAYAKEPGEQELVIFRGPEDLEDAGMPQATVVMEPLSEDGEETLHSRDNSQVSQYPPLPATPMNEPLLQSDDSSADISIEQPSQPPGNDMPRRSPRISSSPQGPSSVGEDAPAYDDQRGEVPSYFEVVDLQARGNEPGEASPAASPTTLPLPDRRSGFRTLLHSLPNRLSMHGSSHTPTVSHHSRTDSTSAMSSETPHGPGRETSQSRTSHRPSASGSSSVFSFSHFRTLSRQKSLKNMNNNNLNNLNSPSMISLDSISAPLTHTLTRTEFTYPKSGPTPEQLKLISSRDSFARFGVPYGADAIAFAASTSRQSLGLRPPDFDVSPSSPSFESLARPESAAGPSRLRTMSSPRIDSSPTPSQLTSAPTADSPPQEQEDPVAAPASSATSAPNVPPVSNVLNTNTATPESSQEPNQDQGIQPINFTTQTSLEIETGTGAVGLEADARRRQSVRQSLSYRVPSIFADDDGNGGDDRPTTSRVSSAASFATASESILPPPVNQSYHQPPPNGFDDDEGGDIVTPSTPKNSTKHVLEPTDATIKQGVTAAAANSSGSSN